MKKIISKVLLVLMLINGIFSIGIYAEDTEMLLFNDDKKIVLSTPIEQAYGKYYMAYDELNQYVAGAYYNDHVSVNSYDGSLSLICYIDSNVVRANNNSLLYNNPVIVRNGTPYISIELFAMVFSTKYDVVDNNIYINVRKPFSKTVLGKIYLPENDVAPPGGVSVTVFMGEVSTVPTPGTGGGSAPPYYNGGYPVDSSSNIHFRERYMLSPIVSATIVIPEGANGTTYSISDDHYLGYGIGVGYTIDSDKYVGGYYCNGETVFTLHNDPTLSYYDNINMGIIEKKHISGRISLPDNETAANDIDFDVIIKGRYYGYTMSSVVTVKTGQSYAEYSISVPGIGDHYTLSVSANNSPYLDLQDNMYIHKYTDDITLDFQCQYAKKVTGKVLLPPGVNLYEDLTVELLMQDICSPHSISDSTYVTIRKGSTEATYELLNKKNLDEFIVFYRCESQKADIYSYGHYNSAGIYLDINKADVLTLNGYDQLDNIDFELIENKLLTANISLPHGYTAKEDITGHITVFPVYSQAAAFAMGQDGGGGSSWESGGTWSGGVTYPGIIFKGSDHGTVFTRFPAEKNTNYIVALSITGDDRFYDRTYYNDASTTSRMEMAGFISGDTQSVDMELLTQNKISGTVNYASDQREKANFNLAVYPQFNTGIRSDIYMRTLNVRSNIYATNGSLQYSFFVPSDITDYIIGISKTELKWNARYYTKNRLVENIEEAEILTVTEDTENIDMNYTNYDPSTPIKVQFLSDLNGNSFSIRDSIYKTGELVINLQNFSDDPKENLKVYAGFYNFGDRLIRLDISEIDIIKSNSRDSAVIYLPKLDKSIVKLKIFVWDDNLAPLSNIYETY